MNTITHLVNGVEILDGAPYPMKGTVYWGETGSTDGRKLARGLGHKNIKANDDFYFNEYALAA